MFNQIKKYMAVGATLFCANVHSVEIITAINFDGIKKVDDMLLLANNTVEPCKIDIEGWSFGCQSGGSVVLIKEGNNGFISATYPVATGAMYVWGGYDISALNTREIYIQFRARLPEAKQGLKFLKIFGQRESGKGYANTTIALVSDPGNQGGITQVSFGDGSSVENDTQNVINLDGTYKSWVGRSYNKGAIIKTPQNANWSSKKWGDSWHTFKVRVKFNSGNTEADQQPDGAYFLSIDDVVYVDAKNLYNRHYLNKPIQRVSFFDWAQNGTSPFTVQLDDITISSEGFPDGPKPPPSAKMK